ncbi:MAG: FCD domain-containing protein [Planctomycetota bacterium]
MRIRQGGAARVLDYQAHAGLDLLSELLFAGGDLDLRVARSVVEMRACLGPEIARRCAERRSPEGVARLIALVEGLRQEPDLGARQTTSLAFWDALVEGSQNVAYRLAFNSLRASYDRFRGALVEVLAEELRDVDGFQAVVDAVAAGDPEAARRAASALLSRGASGLEALFAALEEPTS